MHIERIRVRPRKNPPANICAAQLTSMLNCWMASGDIMSASQCRTAADDLFRCMATTPFKGRPHQPTINYHLARLNKKIQK
ncbi:uncharacterized protein PHACADRAFT_144385 [Phanerochaete carnosa HHB-10118-sp]|uniref:CHCH domain-containing protein n=1 Tax=Phanerochaete carnosa (strain HHB-10118-sp) TaxID=650164 RepID=K5VVV6_PHACS|nr:uncharacterized protein PHACADRAFT_144385 [Phanerochaete carnosa HHB-10118-sp]EKM55688.1 hypothetical protein PHACADRAFT_144385 [Phanerochaete carnosa HHB-10118-sp]